MACIPSAPPTPSLGVTRRYCACADDSDTDDTISPERYRAAVGEWGDWDSEASTTPGWTLSKMLPSLCRVGQPCRGLGTASVRDAVAATTRGRRSSHERGPPTADGPLADGGGGRHASHPTPLTTGHLAQTDGARQTEWRTVTAPCPTHQEHARALLGRPLPAPRGARGTCDSAQPPSHPTRDVDRTLRRALRPLRTRRWEHF